MLFTFGDEGPYDELLFVRPSNGPLFLELENYSLPRITRCFVSTPQALQIGKIFSFFFFYENLFRFRI